MAEFYAGTSGWAYPSWKPDFYPEKLAQVKFLQYYSSKLNTVEVNFTFRQLVKPSTIDKWIAETPPHFLFGVKAHQVFTHVKRLKGCEEFLKRFLFSLEPLAHAKKLGPILFQLPPNMKADEAVLNGFLSILPRGTRMAFEFRNPSWFTDSTFESLRKHNVALCVAESEERMTPDITTANFAYYRYRRPEYSPEERKLMVATIQGHLAESQDVFAYFKHEETPQGATYAMDVLQEIMALRTSVAP